MRIKHSLTWVFLVTLLGSVTVLRAQDLSKYHKFSLGTTMAELSKQTGARPADVTVISKSPESIKELPWWPSVSAESTGGRGAIREVLFSFYKDKLYRILVTYDEMATEGFTNEDMAKALSAQYGAPAASTAELAFPAQNYASIEKVIDRWEDTNYSVSLFRFSLTDGFGLLLLTKQADEQATAAIDRAEMQAKQQASQDYVDRQKKETDDLQKIRLRNLRGFQP